VQAFRFTNESEDPVLAPVPVVGGRARGGDVRRVSLVFSLYVLPELRGRRRSPCRACRALGSH
jgi:hypothetical protein